MKFEVNGHNIFLIVAICFLASLLLVQVMKKVAIFLDIMDKPDPKRKDLHKIHTKPIPLLGGLGIYASFLIGYILFAPKNNLMISVLISSFLIILLGLFDDMTKSKCRKCRKSLKFRKLRKSFWTRTHRRRRSRWWWKFLKCRNSRWEQDFRATRSWREFSPIS